MLKFILIATFTLTTLSAQAESFDCVSEDGRWAAQFEVLEKNAVDLSFYNNAQLMRSFKTDLGFKYSDYKWPVKERYYEIYLGGFMYVNIHRPIKGKRLASHASATFLAVNNPVGFERHVECTITE